MTPKHLIFEKDTQSFATFSLVFIEFFSFFNILLIFFKYILIELAFKPQSMSELTEYLIAIAVCSPVFFFIIAVVFRLLDNSASLFLDNEILVDSSYVSADLIKQQIEDTEDIQLKKSLKKSLLYRKLHNLFMILAVVALPPVIIACFLLTFVA